MKYKFTRVYLVEAKTEAEASQKCQDEPTRYFTYSSVAVESGEARPTWRSEAKKQIIGR